MEGRDRISEKTPVLLYNERCSVCYRLARLASAITRGRILVIGMHSEASHSLRSEIHSALGGDLDRYSSMPWFVGERKILGGAAVIPAILLEAVKAVARPGEHVFEDPMPLSCEPRPRTTGILAKAEAGILLAVAVVRQSWESMFTKLEILERKEPQKDLESLA